MINDIDKDGSGTIDFDEFLQMMTAKMGERDSREEIMKAFRLFDDDETGKISFKNLKRVAKELGENMTDEELMEMIEEVRTCAAVQIASLSQSASCTCNSSVQLNSCVLIALIAAQQAVLHGAALHVAGTCNAHCLLARTQLQRQCTVDVHICASSACICACACAG